MESGIDGRVLCNMQHTGVGFYFVACAIYAVDSCVVAVIYASTWTAMQNDSAAELDSFAVLLDITHGSNAVCRADVLYHPINCGDGSGAGVLGSDYSDPYGVSEMEMSHDRI